MSEINGLDNEYEFVKYLNKKKISELNPMFYDLIKSLFPQENESSTISCWRNHYKQKSDIFVKINNTMKGISIKKGMKNSFHVERISDFINFLIENKVEKEYVIEYLKYHYADGSINGKGNKRLSAEEYRKTNQTNIDLLNLRLNNKYLIIKALERFIIQGRNSEFYVDAIIHGEVNDFIWILREDIIKIILDKTYDSYSAVHFGPMIIQTKNRCLNYNSKYESDRYLVQIKWYNLYDCIIENMNNKVIINSTQSPKH